MANSILTAAKKAKNDKFYTQSEISRTDAKIDRLAYELYGLTEDEIKIVEGGEV
ncbi:hypothetical protein J0A67_08090 [Algoriphagus aestuariicola]|uniref:Uncharacterized protein n=1 Tax=Algoriphagus aestuariicola TaxID=1852016 RepID=A0ABS3BNG4_9BACT|nr:hypothetical protein [Algoriphagus aestuariicola]MBN7800816.1 hypothetical protein [Algoriphagus aestuariicola]